MWNSCKHHRYPSNCMKCSSLQAIMLTISLSAFRLRHSSEPQGRLGETMAWGLGKKSTVRIHIGDERWRHPHPKKKKLEESMQVPLLFCRTIATFLTAHMFFTQCQMHLSYKLMWQPHSQILCDRSPYKGIPPIQQSHGLLVDFWHVQSGLWHCRIMSGLMRWSDQDDWRFLTNGTIGVESEFQSWDVEHHLRAFWELLWCQFKIVQCLVFFERFKAVSNFWSLFFGHDIDDYFVVFRPGSILKDQKLALQQPRWYFQKNQIQRKLGLNMIERHFNVYIMLLFLDTWEILRGKHRRFRLQKNFLVHFLVGSFGIDLWVRTPAFFPSTKAGKRTPRLKSSRSKISFAASGMKFRCQTSRSQWKVHAVASLCCLTLLILRIFFLLSFQHLSAW